MGLLTLEVALAGFALLAASFIFFVYFRRRLISHGRDVMMCGFRAPHAPRWRPALLRMTPTTLQVFPLFGWTLRAAVTWTRSSLDLESIATLEDDGRLTAVLDQTGRTRKVATFGVTDAGTPMRFDLALGSTQYTVLRYWVEASPPSPTWAV